LLSGPFVNHKRPATNRALTVGNPNTAFTITMTKSLSPIRSFLQTLDRGTLFVKRNHTVQDILDSVEYDDESNRSTRCLQGSPLGFTERLLLEAADYLGNEIFECLSKAQIVARYLNYLNLAVGVGDEEENPVDVYFS
jgi:hypothetical protein